MDVSHIKISNVEGQDFGGWEIRGGVTPKPEGGQWEWVEGGGGAGGGGDEDGSGAGGEKEGGEWKYHLWEE